jgi:hypothetical protein
MAGSHYTGGVIHQLHQLATMNKTGRIGLVR